MCAKGTRVCVCVCVCLRACNISERYHCLLVLISRLCACVVKYVSAAREIERDEGREAITLLLLAISRQPPL